MVSPCLCGDPACGRCFPDGQTWLACPSCRWQGRRYDSFSDDDGQVDECPVCRSQLVENEPGYDGRDGNLEEEDK
jgi:hypothetical protein